MSISIFPGLSRHPFLRKPPFDPRAYIHRTRSLIGSLAVLEILQLQPLYFAASKARRDLLVYRTFTEFMTLQADFILVKAIYTQNLLFPMISASHLSVVVIWLKVYLETRTTDF